MSANQHDNLDITDYCYYHMIYGNQQKDLAKLLHQHEFTLQMKNTGNLPVHSQNVRVYGEVTGISRVYRWATGFFYIT